MRDARPGRADARAAGPAPGPRDVSGPSRRQVLRAGLATGLAGLVLPGAAACTPAARTDAITVAGGESGGFYLEFATLLATSLTRRAVARTASAVQTQGSLENIDRLVRGEVTLGIALADSAADSVAGRSASAAPSSASIRALGKVYENYLHCLVRADSGIGAVADLAGRTVGVGGQRSGTSLTARRILEAAGLSGADRPAGLTELPLGLNQGVAALRDGRVEGLFWSGGLPTAAITAAAKDTKLRLVDLSALIAPLRARYQGFYDRVLIQAGTYPGMPATWTVGVANVLLCRADMGADVARSIVELLLTRAGELVPASSLGVQFLSPETLINTAGVPLHPAAEDAYRAFHG